MFTSAGKILPRGLRKPGMIRAMSSSNACCMLKRTKRESPVLREKVERPMKKMRPAKGSEWKRLTNGRKV